MPHFSDMCFIGECCAVKHTLLQLSGADANPYISGIFEVKSKGQHKLFAGRLFHSGTLWSEVFTLSLGSLKPDKVPIKIHL